MLREALLCLLALTLAAASYLQFDPASPFAIVHSQRDPGWDTSELHKQHAVEEFDHMLATMKLTAEERARVLQMRADAGGAP